MIQRYVVTREVDRLAPEWLADRFYNAIKVCMEDMMGMWK